MERKGSDMRCAWIGTALTTRKALALKLQANGSVLLFLLASTLSSENEDEKEVYDRANCATHTHTHTHTHMHTLLSCWSPKAGLY